MMHALLGKNSSFCGSLGSLWMVLTHEGVSLVISNLSRDVHDSSNPLGNGV